MVVSYLCFFNPEKLVCVTYIEVASAALAHDEAMHWAGVAQRELEDFDHQALPVDLLRQVCLLKEKITHTINLARCLGKPAIL